MHTNTLISTLTHTLPHARTPTQVLQSPFTLMLSIFVLGTKPEVQDILSMIAIIFGMSLVVLSKREEKPGGADQGPAGGHEHGSDEEEQRRLIVGDKSS